MPDNHNNKDMQTTCCIAGGGPGGMMLGFLLARLKFMRRIPARVIGIGFRPEHIRDGE